MGSRLKRSPFEWKNSIQFKLLTWVLCLIILSLAITSFLGIRTTNQVIRQSSQNQLHSELTIGRSLLESRYNGNWAVLSGKLWKGDAVVNGNNGMASVLSKQIGAEVTIFQNGQVIATSIQDHSGSYVRDITLPSVAKTILASQKTYIGEQSIAGQTYEVAYQPIMGNRNQLIGVWSIASPITGLINRQTIFLRNSLLIALVVLLVSIFVSWWFSKRLVKPLKNLIEVSRQIGNGNLAVQVQVSSKDEIGELAEVFNDMTGSLRKLIYELSNTSMQLAAAAQEFTSSADETNSSAKSVTATIEETAQHVNGQAAHAEQGKLAVRAMADGVYQIADRAKFVSESSNTTTQFAQQGNASVQSAVGQMNAVGDSIDELSALIHALGDKSKNIGQIIEVITELSSQTNLLALNAAIEAARAGDQGRGFAVVAAEVRKLADQSSNAAGQIGQSILDIQKVVSRAVSSMQAAQADVVQGVEAVRTTSTSFEHIQYAAKQVEDQILEVSTFSRQLTERAENLLDSMEYISNTTIKTVESTEHILTAAEEQVNAMEQVAASANGLSDMADKLQGFVAQFKV